jgi:hypothetical protein
VEIGLNIISVQRSGNDGLCFYVVTIMVGYCMVLNCIAVLEFLVVSLVSSEHMNRALQFPNERKGQIFTRINDLQHV